MNLPRPVLAASLIGLELFVLILLYQLSADLECRRTGAETACLVLRSAALRTLTLFFAFLIYLWLDRAAYQDLQQRITRAAPSRPALGLHFAGGVLMILPVALFGLRGVEGNFAAALALMGAGGALAATGLLRWLLPFGGWLGWLQRDNWKLPLVALIAVFLPELAALVAPLWTLSTLNVATFELVTMTLFLSGNEVVVQPEMMRIGTGDFIVVVASQCSGVEGFVLVTGFMAIYAVLARENLRFARYWGVLFPLALLASWVLNILRIAGLILLGAHVSLEHAVNGFHSYAGWLMFTLLAILIVVLAEFVSWFHKHGPAGRPVPAGEDNVPYLVPFVVMMLSAVLASTFWPDPDQGYPLRVVMMALGLAVFWRFLRGLSWRPSLVALAGGVLIALIWLGFAHPPVAQTSSPDPFWIATRLLGTIALVPVIEELFFRGYLLRLLNRGGPAMLILALAVSSGLFALLHGKWLLAGVAGVLLGMIYLRRNRIADAIWAHAIANALIASAAFLTGNWALI